MTKAVYNGVVIAEADDADIIRIEGATYFPPSSINEEYFKPTELKTTCHWKGEASYYNIELDGKIGHDLAWTYKEPMEGSIEKVGKDFSSYISFYPQVDIQK